MKNIDLNPGGIIGALLAIGGAIAAMYVAMNGLPNRFGGVLLISGFAGGAAGNWLWTQVFPPPTPPNDQRPVR